MTLTIALSCAAALLALAMVAVVIGRESEFALYNADLASFDSKTFNQSESLGAVKAHGMQSRQYFHLKYKGENALSGASPYPLLGRKAE